MRLGVQSWTQMSSWVLQARLEPRHAISNCNKAYCHPIKIMSSVISSCFLGKHKQNFTKALSRDDLSQKNIWLCRIFLLLLSWLAKTCVFEVNNAFYLYLIKQICCSFSLPFQRLFCNRFKQLLVALSGSLNSFLIVAFLMLFCFPFLFKWLRHRDLHSQQTQCQSGLRQM